MNKIKKRIFVVLIILIIIILIISGVLLSNKNAGTEKYYVLETDEEYVNEYDGIYFYEYIDIKTCLQTYLDYLNKNNFIYYEKNESGKYVKSSETIQEETIYKLLSENYIKNNNITINNIYNYVNVISEKNAVIPIKIDKISDESSNVQNYMVKSMVTFTNNKENYSYMYVLINIDSNNRTFSVEPVKDENNTKVEYNITTIENKDVNIYNTASLSNQDIIKDYINNYKIFMLSDVELAYSYLNEEYKQKRFKTLDEFKKHIENNKEKIESTRVYKYTVNYLEEGTEYICQDQYGRYYIFTEKEPLDYSVMLDTYTVDISKVSEKYNSANSLEKGGYNIERCIEAINNKDYTYVYNKLYDEFKNNNYKTEESFEKVIKNKLFDTNVMKIDSTENEGNIYIYNLIIQDGTNSEKQTNMKIIMQLKEGTDFAISFSF